MKPRRQDLTPLQSASISTFSCEIGGSLVEAMTAKIDSMVLLHHSGVRSIWRLAVFEAGLSS
jgi:hypothetical protein